MALYSLNKSPGLCSRQKGAKRFNQQSLIKRVNAFPEFPVSEFSSDFTGHSWSHNHPKLHEDWKIKDLGYHKWLRLTIIHNLRLVTLLP